MTRHIDYGDKCQVYNTNTDHSVTAEVLDFQPERSLSVAVGRAVKVVMRYNERNKKYIGSVGNMEFISDGPEAYSYRTRR